MLERVGGKIRKVSRPQIPKGLRAKLTFNRTELFRIIGRGVGMLLLEASNRQINVQEKLSDNTDSA